MIRVQRMWGHPVGHPRREAPTILPVIVDFEHHLPIVPSLRSHPMRFHCRDGADRRSLHDRDGRPHFVLREIAKEPAHSGTVRGRGTKNGPPEGDEAEKRSVVDQVPVSVEGFDEYVDTLVADVHNTTLKFAGTIWLQRPAEQV